MGGCAPLAGVVNSLLLLLRLLCNWTGARLKSKGARLSCSVLCFLPGVADLNPFVGAAVPLCTHDPAACARHRPVPVVDHACPQRSVQLQMGGTRL